ncbi:MAG: L-aspartate oxidase [Planctomycetota bacterium]|nr:MAG: L-aspartate oxidase [Planctomycetota bacterium]
MLERTPRYAVAFHPKRVPHRFADVLVIGGGLAGLRAALAVPADQSVLVITKGDLRQSNSNYAQGGIAGVIDPEDRFEDHIADTLTAGGELCDPEVVEMVVHEAPERITELIEWGTRFDQVPGGLALGREGGHSHHRIVHALGDATGKEVMRAVIDRACGMPNIETWENAYTLDLLTHEEQCRGALVWNRQHGKTFVWAKQTILCTGGAGQIYRETTNPEVATGDGLAIAFRAGAELRDMEFVQFHPTVLYIAGSSRSLITEAMRGEGARLVDRNGYRFMQDYDERGELAPRDIVSRAIVTQMELTQHPNVYLDVTHLDPAAVRKRFPGIAARCAEFAVDITRDRIPVRPGAHYMIGGVTVDKEGRTTLPGLWAAGECTSSGLHGANRLASNSLLEGLVYGAHAGVGAAREAAGQRDAFCVVPMINPPRDPAAELLDLADIRNSLKSLVWRSAGVRREGDPLAEAAGNIDRWCEYVLARQFADPDGWELQNMLTVARVVIEAARQREESRGVHQRIDFPQTDNEHWKRRIAFRRSE